MNSITIESLAESVIEETNADVEIEYTKARQADARHTRADVSRAHELIEYQLQTEIRDGVGKFVDWYRTNHEWYEPLVINS